MKKPFTMTRYISVMNDQPRQWLLCISWTFSFVHIDTNVHAMPNEFFLKLYALLQMPNYGRYNLFPTLNVSKFSFKFGMPTFENADADHQEVSAEYNFYIQIFIHLTLVGIETFSGINFWTKPQVTVTLRNIKLNAIFELSHLINTVVLDVNRHVFHLR